MFAILCRPGGPHLARAFPAATGPRLRYSGRQRQEDQHLEYKDLRPRGAVQGPPRLHHVHGHRREHALHGLGRYEHRHMGAAELLQCRLSTRP